jgi:hypothetical protein
MDAAQDQCFRIVAQACDKVISPRLCWHNILTEMMDCIIVTGEQKLVRGES